MPHDNSYSRDRDERRRTLDESKLYLGRVVGSGPTQPFRRHHIEVQTRRFPTGTLAYLHPSAHGDMYVPPEGTIVLLRRTIEGDLVVVKSLYDNTNPIPDADVGERIIGQPTSNAHLKLNQRGGVELRSPHDIWDTSITNKEVLDKRSEFRIPEENRHAIQESRDEDSDTWGRVETYPNGRTVLENSHGAKVDLKTNGDVVINEGTVQVVTDVEHPSGGVVVYRSPSVYVPGEQ